MYKRITKKKKEEFREVCRNYVEGRCTIGVVLDYVKHYGWLNNSKKD